MHARIYERLAHYTYSFTVLSAAVATSGLAKGLAYTDTVDFKEVAGLAGIL